MVLGTTGIVTPVSWAFAPDWLTVGEASHLSGHDKDTIVWLILDGGIDAKRDGGTWLVDKWSLHDFQEALAEVLHWWG